MSTEDYEGVFRSLFDGKLDDEQFRDLDRSLLESPELRKSYIRYAEMEGLLEDACLAAPVATADAKHRSSWVVGSALAALATSWLLFFLWRVPVEQPFGYQPSTLEGHTDVALIADWQPGEQGVENMEQGMRLKPGKIKLPSGRLRLLFNGGAELKLNGPAELHLLSEGEATLLRGKADVNIPSLTSQFVLNSPHSSFVDNHSRYSLSVNAGISVVNVFEGSLEASQLGDDGYTYTSQRIQSSQSLWATTSSLSLRPNGPTDWEIPPAAPLEKLDVTEEYVELVRNSEPIVYWRFEGSSSLQAQNEVGSGLHAEVVSSGSEPGMELIDGMASFRDTPHGRILLATDPIDNFLEGDYSIEFWVRLRSWRRQAILSLVGDDSHKSWDHGILFEYADEGTKLVHPSHAFRFLHRNPLGLSGGVNLFTSGGCPINTWHHLVAVKETGAIRFYHNGELVCRSNIGRDVQSEKLRCYIGQLRILDRETPVDGVPSHYEGLAVVSEIRRFNGDIDEVAIYRHQLSAWDVRRHYQAVAEVNTLAPPVEVY